MVDQERTIEQIDVELQEVDAWIAEITKSIQPPASDEQIKKGRGLVSQWAKRGMELIEEREALIKQTSANDN